MLEQYKQYAADLANIGSRYSAMNTFYMSVLTALTGLLALTEGNKPLKDVASFAGVLLPAFAAIACVIWGRSLSAYRHVFAAKFQVLRAMEEKLEFKPYTRENEALGNRGRITGVDQALPWALAIVYAAIACAIFFKG